ncbi:hypothetical protein E8D34_15010 [Nocardioides sp. GY 10113]|uniref:hypothetical protein n=1 Tax=Nocardioides sp. GY 10113 TaxID=2569761 RepID=UPI0010A8EA6B|nr:hypothetical protein [Nocardioides sp. GY 10113]TIC83869.1 hypothetical protein E8D34_15010 [Nocardioides sp. GY 10113]
MGEHAAEATDPVGTTPAPKTTPLLIYVPGLGASEENTADQVADSIRASLDPQRPGSFRLVDAAGVPSPSGLRVSKTIVDENDVEVLQLFQFDYAARLVPRSSGALPPVVPGAVRAVALTGQAILALAAAFRRPAKRWQTKVQLWLGVGACAVLAFGAVYAAVGLLAALGVTMPSWLKGFYDGGESPWISISSLGVVVTWAALRNRLLGVVGAIQASIWFVKNTDVIADSVSQALDQAIDGLRPSGWVGPVHLLGYSFGSLVLFETFFPRDGSLRDFAPPEEVASMVTVGCPLDMVRLFSPGYDDGRIARKDDLRWTNVFIEADVFASNLVNGDDKAEGAGDVSIGAVRPTSIRYTERGLSPLQIFTSGKVHAGYWGKDRASCFGELAPSFVAPAAPRA